MNLAFLAALITAVVGAVLAVVDLLSDSTNIEGAVYFLTVFVALGFFFLGLIVGKRIHLDLNE